MKIANKIILSSILLLNFACTVTTDASLGTMSIDTSKLTFNINNKGNITEITDKTFNAGETAQINFTVNGLKINNAKVKINQDLIVKYDGKEVINDPNAMGTDGKEMSVSSIVSNYSGNNGEVPLFILVPIPQGVKSITVNVNVRDLNSPGSNAQFETSFNVR